FSSRRRHTRSYGDWSSDVCSSDLVWSARRKGMPAIDGRPTVGVAWMGDAPSACLVDEQSEHELQPELDFAHRFSGAVDLAVERVGQRRVRIVPDRSVQNVEPFEPEL